MNKTKKLQVISLTLILMVGWIVGFVYFSELESERTIEFFHEYTIATNYIDSAIQTQKIAEINYDYYLVYTTQEEGYYYEDAEVYLDDTISDLQLSLEQLERSESILSRIKPNSPNEFYNTEVELRSEQIEYLILISEKRIQMIELDNEYLYEINYGTQSEIDRIFNELNSLIDKFNDDIDVSIKADRQIDIHWGENFYPN